MSFKNIYTVGDMGEVYWFMGQNEPLWVDPSPTGSTSEAHIPASLCLGLNKGRITFFIIEN